MAHLFKKVLSGCLLFLASVYANSAAHADASCQVPETIAVGEVYYCYDALGRLISVYQSEDEKTEYEYDAAGNRTNVSSEGSGSPPGERSGFVVVPLNGFTIIPIGTN